MKNTGSALIDYVIPTALIGLVCAVSLYYMISDGKLLGFLGASANMDVNTSDQMAIIGDKKVDENSALNKLVGGSFGGTPDNPVKKCTDGTCVVDFGEFILNGIPENFGEFVENNGVSGGTDNLISYAQQIAEQLENQGKIAESSQIKKFANIGHNIARIEKEFEKVMIACNPDPACAREKFLQGIPKPTGFDESYTSYDKIYAADGPSFLRHQVGVGIERREQNERPLVHAQRLADGYLTALFVNEYQSLMDSTGITSTTKGVLQELYWYIGKLGEDVEDNILYIENGDLSAFPNGGDYSDPITGIAMDNNPDLTGNPFQTFNNYRPSTTTHLDSSLICATGKNYDSGTKCH